MNVLRFASVAGFAMLVAIPAVAAPLPKPVAFSSCAACHQASPAGRSMLGPNLWAVGGRKAGSVRGFAYSPAMKASPVKWDRAKLTAFITKPQAVIPGTRMAFVGIKDPVRTKQVVDYLLSLK